MFGNILGKSKDELVNKSEIVQKISKMNLVEMKSYVNGRISNLEVCEDGLAEVMRKLVSKDAKGNRFIESEAMDTKKSKAFELVILLAANKKVTVVTLELIQEFISMYEDIISQMDKDNMQIYASRLKDALANCLATIESMTALNKKMGVIGS